MARRGTASSAATSQAIPPEVANRMARRIVIATGTPTLLGMAVFVVSYLLVSRGVLEIPPGITLATSGGCFLLGLLGLSYGVFSASWEAASGSLLGLEQIGVNLARVRQSLRSMRGGEGAGGTVQSGASGSSTSSSSQKPAAGVKGRPPAKGMG